MTVYKIYSSKLTLHVDFQKKKKKEKKKKLSINAIV